MWGGKGVHQKGVPLWSHHRFCHVTSKGNAMEMVVMASESIGFKSMEDTGLNLLLMF